MGLDTVKGSPDKNAPGRIEVIIKTFQDGDPNFQKPDGKGNAGISLATAREELGRYEGEMFDPHFKQKHHIDLRQWAKSDPDKTFVQITFRFIPESSPIYS